LAETQPEGGVFRLHVAGRRFFGFPIGAVLERELLEIERASELSLPLRLNLPVAK
jgi:hypothetical protein